MLEDNRSLSRQVEEKKSEADGLTASHGALCQRVAGLEARVEAARGRNTMASIGADLKSKAAAEEEASEAVAEKFLAGGNVLGRGLCVRVLEAEDRPSQDQSQ